MPVRERCSFLRYATLICILAFGFSVSQSKVTKRVQVQSIHRISINASIHQKILTPICKPTWDRVKDEPSNKSIDWAKRILHPAYFRLEMTRTQVTRLSSALKSRSPKNDMYPTHWHDITKSWDLAHKTRVVISAIKTHTHTHTHQN